MATVKIDYGIEEVLAAEFLMGSSLGHAAAMGKGAVLCTAKEPGFVSDGYHLDQVTHRQKAHDLVVLRHYKVANPFLSHEPTGIASAVIDMNLNQGSIHHGPDAGAARRETGREHFPHHVGLGHETDHVAGLKHEERTDPLLRHHLRRLQHCPFTRNRLHRRLHERSEYAERPEYVVEITDRTPF